MTEYQKDYNRSCRMLSINISFRKAVKKTKEGRKD